MGSGRWSTDVYEAAARLRGDTSAFGYSDSGARRVHPALDPFDITVRESRDSAEHPASLAIAVLFDVTGSMGSVPRTLQAKLPQLLGLLLRKNYARHPQILFGAIGDATVDRAPLQIGQFESDNRMDGDLERILLEGGGGGQKTESYELAMYFMARHTAIDCWEKRRKRGYLFIVGDEMAYPKVKPREVSAWIGDELAEPVPLRHLTAELTRSWDTYYILPRERRTRGTARSSASGANCSARTSSSSPILTRCARRSRSRSASARTRSTWTAAWPTSPTSAPPRGPRSPGHSPSSARPEAPSPSPPARPAPGPASDRPGNIRL